MSVHQRISIPTLSGGVGRQASNKRLPSEAENLNNCLVTLEKSVEKRPAMEFIAGSDLFYSEESTGADDFPAPGSLLFNLLSDNVTRYQPTAEDDILFKWISIDSDNRFLIAINYSLSLDNSAIFTRDEKRKFITVWKLNKTNKRMDLQSFDFDSLTLDHYNYLTQNPNLRSAVDTFDFALFGSAIIILNKQVSARYRDDIARDISNNKITSLALSTSDTNTFRLKVVLEEGQFDKFILTDNQGIAIDTTLFGFHSTMKFGVNPYLLELTVTDASDDSDVCSFSVNKFKAGNDRFEFQLDDVDLITGNFPVNTDQTYKFALNLYSQDFKGRKLNYRSASLGDGVGKNLVPVLETTKLADLTTKPLEKLFLGDVPSAAAGEFGGPNMHIINNSVDVTFAGNAKDPSVAVSGDTYFADKFFISRGSVQYSVELNEYDTNLSPNSTALSVPEGLVLQDDLKVTQKLRPVTTFVAENVERAGTTPGANVTTLGTNIVCICDETKTIGDLKSIIEESGADATLSIDSATNQLKIVDDSQENLTLLATHENFNTGHVGNQNFVEALGLGNSNSKSLRTINEETKLNELTDEEGNVLITPERINNFAIIREQVVNIGANLVTGSEVIATIDVDVQVDGISPTSTLAQLDEKIFKSTSEEYGLYYADNNKRVKAGNASDNAVGVKIMKIEVDSNNNPIDEGKSTALVIDLTTEAPLEEDGETLKQGRFAELLGLKNTLRNRKLVVEDKNFNVSQQTDLGQSVVSFQNIPVPTEENDTIKSNSASDTLYSLYEGGTLTTSATKSQKGRGKVYECRERFFDFVPGFYRAVNEPDEGNPYYEIVRAEDRYSVLDERTWPLILDFNVSNGLWKMITPSWQPRKSGSLSNNPGPSPFIAANANERVGQQITSITTWRNRLWFAIGDTIFSSEFNNFFNVFLTDPGTITDIDMIDVRSSLDKVSKINSMIPFYDFLFVNTDNDIQFELQGSENQITPFTAELSPTTFYSSDPISQPQLLGSQIYFFAPQKIYLYYSTANQSNVTQAIETTTHAEGYLPTNFGAIARAPAQDSLLMVDADNKNELYVYTQRFAGDKVSQNSLSKYIFDTDMSILSTEVFDNYFYAVTSRPFSKKDNSIKDYYFVERTFLETVDTDIPRLDRLHFLEPDQKVPEDTDTVFNIEYDDDVNSPTFDTTTFILPYQDANANTIIFGAGYGEYTGRSISCVNITEAGKKTRLRVQGKLDDILAFREDQGFIKTTPTQFEAQGSISQPSGITDDQGFLFAAATGGAKGVFVGVPYTMQIELSPQFVRSQDQSIVDGALNLRTITTRYLDTGKYNIRVERRGNEDTVSITTKRNPSYKEDLYNESVLDSPVAISSEGEFMSKIFGNSEHMKVFIESDHYTPCNITHIEFKGVFKQTYRSGQN